MPFKSEAQRRYMYAKHPRIAKRWEKHTKDEDLPEKVSGMNPTVKNLLYVTGVSTALGGGAGAAASQKGDRLEGALKGALVGAGTGAVVGQGGLHVLDDIAKRIRKADEAKDFVTADKLDKLYRNIDRVHDFGVASIPIAAAAARPSVNKKEKKKVALSLAKGTTTVKAPDGSTREVPIPAEISGDKKAIEAMRKKYEANPAMLPPPKDSGPYPSITFHYGKGPEKTSAKITADKLKALGARSGLGAAVGGGVGAATAKEDNRLKGSLIGAGTGAVAGAVGPALVSKAVSPISDRAAKNLKGSIDDEFNLRDVKRSYEDVRRHLNVLKNKKPTDPINPSRDRYDEHLDQAINRAKDIQDQSYKTHRNLDITEGLGGLVALPAAAGGVASRVSSTDKKKKSSLLPDGGYGPHVPKALRDKYKKKHSKADLTPDQIDKLMTKLKSYTVPSPGMRLASSVIGKNESKKKESSIPAFARDLDLDAEYSGLSKKDIKKRLKTRAKNRASVPTASKDETRQMMHSGRRVVGGTLGTTLGGITGYGLSSRGSGKKRLLSTLAGAALGGGGGTLVGHAMKPSDYSVKDKMRRSEEDRQSAQRVLEDKKYRKRLAKKIYRRAQQAKMDKLENRVSELEQEKGSSFYVADEVGRMLARGV